MKNKKNTLVLSLLIIIFVTTTAHAAPDLAILAGMDGTMDGSEWTGNYSTQDGTASGGAEYAIEKIGILIDDYTFAGQTWALIGVETGMEMNTSESGNVIGDIHLSFKQDGITEGQFGIRFSIDGIQNINYIDTPLTNPYDVDFKLYNTADSDWIYRDELGGGSGDVEDMPFRVKDYGNIDGTLATGVVEEMGPSNNTSSHGTFEAYFNNAGLYSRTEDRSYYDPELNSLVVAVDLDYLTGLLGDLNAEMTYDITASLTESCGNDGLEYTMTRHGDYVIPEPGTFLLFGMGLLGMGALGRRKEKEV